MSSYTLTFAVEQSPADVFAAICHVRGWWSGEVSGDTDRLGAEFTYRVPSVHFCRLRIVELIPATKVTWLVTESDLSYTDARTEWTDTRIEFELSPQGRGTQLRFTHTGLLPDHECYASCSSAWHLLIHGSLRGLIATGQDQPDVFAAGA